MADGHWIKRVQTLDDHKCKPPTRNNGMLGVHFKEWPDGHMGDVWECSCGKQYKIKHHSGEYGPYAYWARKWWRVNPGVDIIEKGGKVATPIAPPPKSQKDIPRPPDLQDRNSSRVVDTRVPDSPIPDGRPGPPQEFQDYQVGPK